MRLTLTKKHLIAIILAALLLVSVAAIATGCKEEETPQPEASALRLNPNSIELYVGNSSTTSVEGLQDGEKVTSWLSNNESVATVDGGGIITAVGVGSTTVRATTDSDRIALVQVVVKDGSMLLVPSITLNASAVTLNVGNDFAVVATLNYNGQSVNGTFSWSTTDSSVVTVQDGTIIAVGLGSASVVCQATYLEQVTAASLDVTVTPLGYAFCPDYQRREIWQGESFDLTISQTIDGKTTTIEDVTYTSNNPTVARADNGVLTAMSGGDVIITANFTHNETPYTVRTTLHVYGKYNVLVYALGYSGNDRDHTIRGKMFGEKITLSLDNQVKGRDIKCWYVNGEPIDGNTFTMPDGTVTAYAKYVNETAGDFTKYFNDGKLFTAQSTALYVKETLTDASGNANHDNNYVKISNTSTAGSSLTFNFDEGIVISSTSVIKINVYLATSSTELCFGVGNTLKRTYSPKQSGITKVDYGKWVELTISTNVFGTNGALLNNIAIGVKGGYVLIDYIMPIY